MVPAGNLGNSLAAIWARALGAPLDRIALSTNANEVVPDYLATGEYRPRPPVATLANAMDVGAPSNMERLQDLYPDVEPLQEVASATWVDDATIEAVIAAGPQRYGRLWCPHTATAVHLREQLGAGHWIVVATAHPAKFEAIVGRLAGQPVPLPETLRRLLERSAQAAPLEPSVEALVEALES